MGKFHKDPVTDRILERERTDAVKAQVLDELLENKDRWVVYGPGEDGRYSLHVTHTAVSLGPQALERVLGELPPPSSDPAR